MQEREKSHIFLLKHHMFLFRYKNCLNRFDNTLFAFRNAFSSSYCRCHCLSLRFVDHLQLQSPFLFAYIFCLILVNAVDFKGNDFKQNVVTCFEDILATSQEFKKFGAAVCISVFPLTQIYIKIKLWYRSTHSMLLMDTRIFIVLNKAQKTD